VRASTSFARACSGDIYATVPSVEPGLVRCCSSVVPVFAEAIWLEEMAAGATLASPKSNILACPRLVTKMLAGLMSRWMMPTACAASRASAMSMAMGRSGSISIGRPAM
jgi:hypothetical protein